ncbi:zinc-binding dehydrogenase [Vibrio sp. Of7-15]|uniref:zinc-binding dehydrogenase n=1 Tax=Vibrio sp. Of7-15 TaxID=2724879 RepID=UPI001EF37437|nr:zinc-binding dehydrogenase [Vibrio sp. Of7-15]MCG7497794.1 zinc-binding dehydrogenase [Vibrio sp. Of7-15]
MKAWLLTKPSSIESLTLGEASIPVPKANEVLIKVAAVGLNPYDYKLAEWGSPNWQYPKILGLDIAGTVIEIGESVTNVKAGDRVFFFANPDQAGGFAEYATGRAVAVSKIPAGMSFIQAATLPCAGFTAWQAIHDKLRLQPGQCIAITGAGGGVGGFATQLALLQGATVYAISSAKHHARLERYGVHAVIDYQSENVPLRLLEVTEDHMVEALIDCVSVSSATKLSRLLRFNGQIVMVADRFDQAPLATSTKAITLHEVSLGAVYAHGDDNHIAHLAYMGEQLAKLVVEDKLDTMIDTVLPFEELCGGLARLQVHHTSGKLVISVTEE